jgi:hypothetical protein
MSQALTNKEITTKSTAAARATVTSGPAAMAAKIRKTRKKQTDMNNPPTNSADTK